MVAVRRAPTRQRLAYPRLGSRLLRPLATGAGGGRVPPTFPSAADLVAGTGTRSFAAQTTAANTPPDQLLVEVIAENNDTADSYTVTCPGLTFTVQTDAGTGASTDTRVMQWTAPDAAGGSRTVQIAPSDATVNYRARVTVVRGSDGPGGKATSLTAQTVSVARQADESAVFMLVGDWSAGPVGTPVWTPGGSTVASEQQGTNATYIFGRWDDSGTAGTAAHGISTPSYATPAIAVLEMKGTAGAGGDATVTPATVAATASVPGPAVAAGATVSPATVPVTASVPAAVVSAGAVTVPASVAALATVPAPTVTAGGNATVTPATVAVAATIPAAAVAASSLATPATVAATASVAAATVRGGATATPATVAATASVAAPGMSTGGTVTAATVNAAAAVATPTVTTSSGSTATPATVAGIATVASPAVQVGSRAAPATIAATASVPAATVRVSAAIAPATVLAVASVPAPAVTLTALATVASVAALATVPAPTVTAVDPIIYGTSAEVVRAVAGATEASRAAPSASETVRQVAYAGEVPR